VYKGVNNMKKTFFGLFIMVFSYTVSAQEYFGVTNTTRQECGISFEDGSSDYTDVVVNTPGVIYYFSMPSNTLVFETSLIQKEFGVYGPYIGAPITIFGLGVRDIKLSLDLDENGEISSYILDVKKIFIPSTHCVLN
jgi:hypothetical protein